MLNLCHEESGSKVWGSRKKMDDFLQDLNVSK